jgi:hypothetical protein
LQNIAPLVQSYYGTKLAEKGDKQALELAAKLRQRYGDEIKEFRNLMQGREELAPQQAGPTQTGQPIPQEMVRGAPNVQGAYDFAASDVTGRIWVSGLSQKSEGLDAVASAALVGNAIPTGGTSWGTAAVAAQAAGNSYTSRGVDVGAKLTAGPATLVGYYYDGKGLDGQASVQGIFNRNGVKSDDDGGYVQGTVVVPGIGTKLGASWGRSNSKHTASTFDIENESWVIGAYHPLTKHLNLVAEYTSQEVKNRLATSSAVAKTEQDTASIGAILFF